MPDPTGRDRYRAAAAELMLWWKDQDEEEGLLGVAEALDEANGEGRKEGIREALDKVPTTWLDPMLTGKRAVFDRNRGPEPNVQNVLLEVRLRITALLDQPPEGEKTP